MMHWTYISRGINDNHITTPALLLDVNSEEPFNLDFNNCDIATDTDVGTPSPLVEDEAIDPNLSQLSTGK